jgi:hypothetical protein
MKDITVYWTSAPPEQSERCSHWVQRINEGWRPNKRLRRMGYFEAAMFYRVYIWEYLNVLRPLLEEKESEEADQSGS